MKYFGLFLTSFLSLGAFAQQPKENNTAQITEIRIVEDNLASDTYELDELQEYPEFPGGNEAMYVFLGNNIQYPQEAAVSNIQGKVVVKFVVKADGSIGQTTILQSVHPALDAEAERLVKLMPNWTPGTLNGKPVNVWFTLPVVFKLQGDTPPAYSVSERDQTDFDNFLQLGDQAMNEGNSNHAFQYYKECFNIKPWEFHLLDKIESLIAGNPDTQQQTYRWANSRMLRECEKNWGAADDYIAKMIQLQEKLVAANPNDLATLGAMEFLYFQGLNFDKVTEIANRMYKLIPKGEVGTLANAIEMDANGRIYSKDYQGVVNLVAPQLDILLTQPAEGAQFAPFFELLEAYIQLNRMSEAKTLISKTRAAYPNDFDRLVGIYCVAFPERASAVQELVK